jgi:hypothetical protein
VVHIERLFKGVGKKKQVGYFFFAATEVCKELAANGRV